MHGKRRFDLYVPVKLRILHKNKPFDVKNKIKNKFNFDYYFARTNNAFDKYHIFVA